MIESRFWRAELRADIRWLRINRKYKRRSEKRVVLYERKLMLVAFQIRTLLDRPKVNDATKALRIDAVSYPKVCDEPYSRVRSLLEEHFDIESPQPASLSAWEVCNQLIHYYEMFTFSNRAGQFTSLVVFSDYKRHTCVYEIEMTRLIDFFAAFSDDASSVCGSRAEWDEKKQDYVWVEARGPRDPSPQGRAVHVLS